MAFIALHIDDLANRITIKALLEAEGHKVDAPGELHELVITDDLAKAVSLAQADPVLYLTPLGEISDAVSAMYKGVFGYIVLPLQPGECAVMVDRALGTGAAQSKPDAGNELRTLDEVEADHILATLRACKHNQAKAARALGIGRNTLWRKLKKIRGEDDSA